MGSLIMNDEYRQPSNVQPNNDNILEIDMEDLISNTEFSIVKAYDYGYLTLEEAAPLLGATFHKLKLSTSTGTLNGRVAPSPIDISGKNSKRRRYIYRRDVLIAWAKAEADAKALQLQEACNNTDPEASPSAQAEAVNQ